MTGVSPETAGSIWPGYLDCSRLFVANSGAFKQVAPKYADKAFALVAQTQIPEVRRCSVGNAVFRLKGP
ncbi:hypothetical protein ASD52_27855 [Ensifer sp. Root142]|nr:hypothetical protein ASD52_27855 [Ensifer sp. Root142]